MAGIAQHNPDEPIREFESKGIVIKDREETIRNVAADNKKENVGILNMIF